MKEKDIKEISELKYASIGEPDANSEFFIAKMQQKDPIFIDAYYDDASSDLDEFKKGIKFILYGQKGTGKTALLRNIERSSNNEGYKTNFVVFKKEILEEAELAALAVNDTVSAVIDEDEIKKTKFFHHAMKRLLLSLLLANCNEIDDPADEDEAWYVKLFNNFKESSAGEIASNVVDNIHDILSSSNINLDKISGNPVKLNPAKIIKRSNDKFLKFCFKQFKKKGLKCRIFLDEMHFAYRDKNSLASDSSLVRDTILAVSTINEKLVEENIDSRIFISIRSEFLEQPEIATADIAHTIQSYGKEISWEVHPHNASHPIFELMASRLSINYGSNFDKNQMFLRFFPGTKYLKFMDYSWGKPRDIVRYFKSAKESFPNNKSITSNEFNAILRKYSNSAWQDIRSTLTAFVPMASLTSLENSLNAIANDFYRNRSQFNKALIIQHLQSAHENMKINGVDFEVDELFRLLYITGIFYFRYKDAVNGNYIYHQYHRGNRRPTENGQVRLHMAVAKAFS